jgi:hypothetical protein
VIALLGRGCRVVVLDDLSNGVADNLPMRDTRVAELRVVKVGDPQASTS